MVEGGKAIERQTGTAGRFFARPEAWINRQATAQPVAWVALVVIGAAAVSLFSRFPAYVDQTLPAAATFVTFPGTPYGTAVAWWLNHPFQPVPTETFFPAAARQDVAVIGFTSHFDKMTFRAFLPLLNGVFRGNFWTLVAACHLAVLVTYGLLFQLARRQTRDPVLATLLVWAYAGTWAGGWGFNDMVCGDAVAVALMLGVLAVRGPVGAALLLIAAGFTDERAILAAPLLGLFRQWSAAPADQVSGSRRLTRAWWPMVAAVLAYAAIRLAIATVWDVHSGTSMIGGREVMLYHAFVSFPAKIFGVFEFLWVFPLGLVVTGLDPSQEARRRALVFALATGCLVGPALMVWDIERSLSYLLPAVLLAVCFSPGKLESTRRLLWIVTVASLAWMQFQGSVLRFLVR